MPIDSDITKLNCELAETRARLAEAEEALNTIRNGEIDALGSSSDNQIFTLKGAQEPYQLLIEQMSEGALTLSKEGVIIYSNQAFSRFLQTPLERVIGTELFISQQTRGAAVLSRFDQSCLEWE